MNIIKWEIPLEADWIRALILKKLYFNAGLILLVEDESDVLWQLTFKTVQAVRIITHECAHSVYSELPDEGGGGLFEVINSTWIKDLGYAHFLKKSKHYIICCYQEVIEVVAWEAEVKLAENSAINNPLPN